MTHLIKNVAIFLAAAGIASGIASCEKKKKKAPPPPPPSAPAAPPPPAPVDVQALMQELKSDQRVKFVEDQAPADRKMAEGVVKLANAIAKGDSGAMKGLLDGQAKSVLQEIEDSGDWAPATKEIEQVRIVSVTNTSEAEPTTTLVGMAIQVPGEAYLLAWTGNKSGDTWVFSNALCQDDKKARASEFDNVAIQSTALPKDDVVFTRPAAGGHVTPGASGSNAPAPDSGPITPKGTKNTPAGPIKIPGGS